MPFRLGLLRHSGPNVIMRRIMFAGRTPLIFVSRGRARFAELDPYGHVNTNHYLGYFLDHRFVGLRERLGLDIASLRTLSHLFVTRKVSLDFLRPLVADEEFEITSFVSEVLDRSCTVQMTLSKVDGTQAARCLLELVCIEKQTLRPCSWPTELIERFFEATQ